MKKIRYVLLLIMAFGVMGIVKAEAEKISVNDIITKFQGENGYSVTNKADGSSFTVNTGTENLEFTYSAADNILTYKAGIGKTVSEVVQTDRILGYIVELSSNKEAYAAAKAANPKPNGVDYGNGCDLLNMGFCYDNNTGNMQVALSNQFTTYLYNYYNGAPALEEPINNAEPAAAASADPLIVQDPEAAPDSSNPDTGTFTEIGIIIALLTLLLIVINLKKKSETEFKI